MTTFTRVAPLTIADQIQVERDEFEPRHRAAVLAFLERHYGSRRHFSTGFFTEEASIHTPTKSVTAFPRKFQGRPMLKVLIERSNTTQREVRWYSVR